MIKAFLISIFFIFLLQYSFSQNTFKLILNGPSYDEGIAAFRTSEKAYRIIGNTSSYGNGGSDIWVIALDSNADFLWQKTYGGSGNENATKAIINSKDEIYITGSTTSNSQSSVNIFVLALTNSGVPIFDKSYGGSDWDFSNSIFFQNDSTILICGKTFNGPNAGFYNSFVMALNSHGDSLWTSFAGSINEQDNRDLIISQEKKIIVVGNKIGNNNSIDTSFIKCLDSLGNLLWIKSLTPYLKGSLLSVALNPDTTFTATGFHIDSTNSWREPLLVKFDKNGNVLWYRDMQQGDDSYFANINAESSGIYNIAGMSTKYSSGLQGIFIAQFSHDGWMMNGNIAGWLLDDYARTITFNILDSTYLIVGTTYNFGVSMTGIIVLQTDYSMAFDTATRFILVSSNTELNIKSIALKIFPNPAHDFLNIQFGKSIDEEFQIEIFSQEGKIIKSNYYSNIDNKISVNDLKPGIYILKMKSKSYELVHKFIKF